MVSSGLNSQHRAEGDRAALPDSGVLGPAGVEETLLHPVAAEQVDAEHLGKAARAYLLHELEGSQYLFKTDRACKFYYHVPIPIFSGLLIMYLFT